MWVVSYEKKTGLPIGKRGKNNDKKSRGACTCTSHEAMIETSCFFPLFSGTEKNENLWALGESRSLKERRLIFFFLPFLWEIWFPRRGVGLVASFGSIFDRLRGNTQLAYGQEGLHKQTAYTAVAGERCGSSARYQGFQAFICCAKTLCLETI